MRLTRSVVAIAVSTAIMYNNTLPIFVGVLLVLVLVAQAVNDWMDRREVRQ